MKDSLEEAAERFAEKYRGEEQDPWYDFMEGAKWQQERSYSEEEVIRFADWILHKRFEMRSDNHQNWWGKFNEEKDYTSKELFEQFKKK